MSVPPPLPIVDVMAALHSLGFVEVPPLYGARCLKYDFGNLELVAVSSVNQYLQRGVTISGAMLTSRTAQLLEFDLPEKVESAMQVAAWIADRIGEDFQPAKTASWLEDGRRNQDLLPWKREMHAYNNRPQAKVARTWMCVLRKELRSAAENARPADECQIHFDGDSLHFRHPQGFLIVPATGNRPWFETVSVCLTSFQAMPARWMDDPVRISLWDDKLTMGNGVFGVIRRAASSN